MKTYPIVRLPDDEAYRWWKLYPDTIVIQYGEGLYTFLLLGEERALLIDTAYGRGDFPNLVQRLAGDRELVVVNTHGHYDHTGGNMWFPKVHMHEKAKAIANQPFEPVDPEFLANLPYPDYEMISVEDGHVFDLGGGRQVTVLHTPAHNESSLSFLDNKRRLLFAGDEFDSGQANLGDLNSVKSFLQNMRRLKSLEDQFDWILPSHNGCPICKEYLDDFITATQHVTEGKPDLVPTQELQGYQRPFAKDGVRVQVGLSCINYRNE